MITVYALVDPRTNMIMYIGQTSRPNKRLTNHMCRRDGTLKTIWIQQLRRRKLKPEMVIIAVVRTQRAADDIEQFTIANIRAAGGNLLNMSDGPVPAPTYHRRPRLRRSLRQQFA